MADLTKMQCFNLLRIYDTKTPMLFQQCHQLLPSFFLFPWKKNLTSFFCLMFRGSSWTKMQNLAWKYEALWNTLIDKWDAEGKREEPPRSTVAKISSSLKLRDNWRSDSSLLTTEICNMYVYTWANPLHSLKSQQWGRGSFRMLPAQLHCANQRAFYFCG